MATYKRVSRLNSLLIEVLSEVLSKHVKNPHIHPFTTITQASITKDLRQAKIYISIIASPEEKKQTLEALNQASGFIGYHASKKVTLRFFPSLTFYLDETVDKHMRIESLIHDIHQEQASRPPSSC